MAFEGFDRIPERLTEQVGKVRDRTAEAVSSDEGSVLREVGKLVRAFDDLADRVDERLDEVGFTLEEISDRLDEVEADAASTTWPRRLFWLLVGAGVGAGAAYMADPDRGEVRRQAVVDAAASRAAEVQTEVQREVADRIEP